MVVPCHTIPLGLDSCGLHSSGARQCIDFFGVSPMKKYIHCFWQLYLIVAVIAVLLVAGGSRIITTMAEAQPIQRTQIIVIDAGHGGEDGGAVSCTGVYESQINLEIALRLNALCHLLGFETRMIRCTDVSVYTQGGTLAAKKASDLKNRVQMVNSMENGILISIHQNTFSDSRYSGAQVFYAHTSGSMELARQVQQQITAIDPQNHRRVKPANHVYLMQHIQRPGILVECGFLSNPQEEAKLRSAEFQKKLCAAIVSTLSCIGKT